ncbi:MAG: alanine--tRNA ligase [Desulfovibrionaceae bacterium]
MLTAKDIRRRFLEYFKENGHEIVQSAPLIPRDDPSLLFTNAGMVPFKKTFLGQEKRSYVRATSSQKCLRVSGKHNDLENVGRTARHHTFFEMLGNFSFGDYFKEQAIRLAWNFITTDLKLPKDRLYVTVYKDDDEAFALWQKVAGLTPERIFRLDEKDNFWSMGDTGPCGPCSEIFIDQGEDMCCGPKCGIGTCDCDRFLEIWNLVFMQYDQPEKGPRTNLPRPSIDTGMGLERIAAVCQGKRSNFDCDLFQDIIQYAASLAGQKYSFSLPDTNDVDTALRVIADHSRATAFLIADGTLPSNEGRGYVLRRLIRRALRFGTLMGLTEPFLYKTVRKVVDVMGEDFPELTENTDFLVRAVREEEERFSLTLEKGLTLLEEELASLSAQNKSQISGAMCFKLYDTYGFPLDIVNDVAEKRGFNVDVNSFTTHMQEQKSRARAAQKNSGLLGPGGKDPASFFAPLLAEGMHATFVGYTHMSADSRIVALLDNDGLPVDSLTHGEGKTVTGYLVSARTPFYGASGGQEGDTGTLHSNTGTAQVRETLKPAPELIVHHICLTKGQLLLDQEIHLQVGEDERLASARNHSCTHLLHAALRQVLGEHVKQAGSLVAPDRLRFDFSHISAMTPDEIKTVERQVNRAIMADLPINETHMNHDEALSSGAMALFSEKYGDVVRVISMGQGEAQESVELCGGTHLHATGQAGCFLILSETGVAAGIRRIEAATGWNALTLIARNREELALAYQQTKAKTGELNARLETMQADIKKLRKDKDKADAQSLSSQGRDLMAHLKDVKGIKVLTAFLGAVSVKALRDSMDDVRSKLPSGIACLAAAEDDKVSLILYVSKDLHTAFTAPALIKIIAAPVGGSGGGRPELAQAGGTNPQGVEDCFHLLLTTLQSA